MKIKNRLSKIFQLSGIALSVLLCSELHAKDIIVEGVVPNDQSKQAILAKTRSIYPQDQVIDKIQVRPVSAPNGWSDSVTQVITPDLKKVSQGKLTVRGTQVDLSGKILNPDEIQSMTTTFQSLIQAPYRFSAQLGVNHAEQAVIDNALKNRIIEFESGSDVLLPAGTQILDEMVIALNRVQGKNVKIIGHTDSQGDPTKNQPLSLRRADAVKNYLTSKGIAAARLSVEGKGSQVPVADNATAEGRKKNRRIEFEVL